MNADTATSDSPVREGDTGRRMRRFVAGLALVSVAASACGGDDESAAADAAPVPTRAASTSPAPTTAVPATFPVTEPEPESTTPDTAIEATTPPTTESCGAFCPLTDEQQAATDAFFAAYNGDDWQAFLDVLATEDPSWTITPEISQDAELMRYDFIWSASMNETWTPERCVDQYGVVSCSVAMEDDLHRLLAPHGMEPSVCQVSLEVVDGRALPKRYDALFGCHRIYDGAMHFYGAWFDGAYPEEEPIQGAHYRGWNQTDETAGERAATHLDEWAVEVDAAFADGGDIFDVTGHP